MDANPALLGILVHPETSKGASGLRRNTCWLRNGLDGFDDVDVAETSELERTSTRLDRRNVPTVKRGDDDTRCGDYAFHVISTGP